METKQTLLADKEKYGALFEIALRMQSYFKYEGEGELNKMMQESVLKEVKKIINQIEL
jgi:hypothetical protein